MLLVLGAVVGLVVVGGAITAGVMLGMKSSPPAVGPPSKSEPRSAFSEVASPIRIEGGAHFLSVFGDAGDGVLRGLGPQVPLHFSSVRAEGEALIFEYVPGLPSAVRTIAMPAPQARALAQRLSARFGLPRSRTVLDVDIEALRTQPASFAGQVIRTRGRWTHGLETSSVAGLWMTPPDGDYERAREHVEIIALVLHGGRFGHLGQWPGELIAFEVKPVFG
jgi:hypothetical protein